MANEEIEKRLPDKVRIAVFASGAGSIAQAIIEFGMRPDANFETVVLISNNSNCGARSVAEKFSIPFRHISIKTHPTPADFERSLLEILNEFRSAFAALAGYNKLIPEGVCIGYRGRILNVHPALLPKYGGPGMFGHIVHQRVIENGELFSGSTVHIVDEQYDHGEIVAQWRVNIADGETAETLEAKIKAREKEMYPVAINSFASRFR